ncbi:response regulator transcription factor [Garicola koreensis]|uniref:response regulator transcription factor n=1 Tax=Garicola koreensis TaxID=1262554 RepID=UPI0031EE60A7
MTQNPASSEPISVLLADDQALLRAGFAMVIDSQPDLRVVAQAGDGAEALQLARQHRPDVVLMDIRMPQLDGLEATAKITEDEGLQATRIIVLTTFDTDEYALQALRSGAAGFLLKDVQPEVLLDSIRTVVTGGAVVAPTTTRRLLDSTLLDPTGQHTGTAEPAPAPSAAQQQKLDLLTTRERELLTEMATGDSNTEIAARLYLSEATVKTHVGQVLAKLGCRDRVQAVVFAYDAGIAARRA